MFSYSNFTFSMNYSCDQVYVTYFFFLWFQTIDRWRLIDIVYPFEFARGKLESMTVHIIVRDSISFQRYSNSVRTISKFHTRIRPCSRERVILVGSARSLSIFHLFKNYLTLEEFRVDSENSLCNCVPCRRNIYAA